jgi:hypothetical protein
MGVETPKRAWTPAAVNDDGLQTSARSGVPAPLAQSGRWPPKPKADFTDLIAVSTTSAQPGPELGAPLSAPESDNDLLGSLVREHLERASATPGKTPATVPEVSGNPSAESRGVANESELASHMARLDSVPPEEAETPLEEAKAEQKLNLDSAFAQETTAAGEEVAAVKRDFAKLFEPDAAAEAGASRESPPPPAAGAAVAAPVQAAARDEVQQDALSSEELDALLSESAAAEKPAAPTERVHASIPVPEGLLADSDGLLEAELRQLMPEAPGEEQMTPPVELPEMRPADTTTLEAHPLPEMPAAPANDFTPPAPLPETARPADVMIRDEPEAEKAPRTAVEATPAVSATAPAEPATQAAAAVMPNAPAGMSAPPPVVVELPERETPVDDSPRSNLFTDIVLMIGQLIDMPFAWISNDTRYLIGIAAFLLFAGAAILFVIHRMIG